MRTERRKERELKQCPYHFQCVSNLVDDVPNFLVLFYYQQLAVTRTTRLWVEMRQKKLFNLYESAQLMCLRFQGVIGGDVIELLLNEVFSVHFMFAWYVMLLSEMLCII